MVGLKGAQRYRHHLNSFGFFLCIFVFQNVALYDPRSVGNICFCGNIVVMWWNTAAAPGSHEEPELGFPSLLLPLCRSVVFIPSQQLFTH